MIRIIILFILYIGPQITLAQGNKTEKILYLRNTNHQIQIDGKIDSVWSLADSSSEFSQFEPFYNVQPSVKTTVKIISDEENLYCLFICNEDNPKNIQANRGMHDGFTGDIVSIMIDTFGDKLSAYKFAVNASGVKSDSRLLDDGRNRDYTWDGIWYAASEIYDLGFVVEIKIPFRSLKFKKDLNQWGIDFDRWRSINKEDIYWCSYEQNEGQRISKFGKLIFDEFTVKQTNLNLEVFPVGLVKTVYQNKKYKVEPTAGLDLTFNPSEQLTFVLTAYPDFAQIEADPYDFNISRYETYFRERRPFFTQGSEIFLPSGRNNNSGFYSPLELFYSRRIGKILPGAKQVPLVLGSKFFGRFNQYDYGALLSVTAQTDYNKDNINLTEPRAVFGLARVKKQILENSSIGLLFVTKSSATGTNSVIDIDGAFRGSDWQLAYQLASSFKNSQSDFALSTGFTKMSKNWVTLFRLRGIGKNFDISEIGFVPWRGTFNSAIVTGPNFYFENGEIQNIFFYGGTNINYEDADLYYDKSIFVGFDIDMRKGWSVESNLIYGKNRDNNVDYNSYEIDLSSRVNISQYWNFNFWSGYSRTYNFRRGYTAFLSWLGSRILLKPVNYLNFGTTLETFFEGDPNNKIHDITFTSRPFVSLTPVNNMNLRLYVDNLFLNSSEKIERLIIGFLFSWNYSPKSWIYLAINETMDRSLQYDFFGNTLDRKLHTIDRTSVIKLNYLYYL